MPRSLDFASVILTIPFAAANTELAILHGMKVIPRGYIVVGQLEAGQVYTSATAWTSTTAYLKSSTITTYRLLFFA
jgi:hypothetical protein